MAPKMDPPSESTSNKDTLPSPSFSSENKERVTKMGSSSSSSSSFHNLSWPEDNVEPMNILQSVAHTYTTWLYSYMNPLLQKGSQQTLADGTHLQQTDLFHIPTSMKASFLSSAFTEHYTELNGEKYRVLNTFWRISKPTFLPAGICQFATAIFQVGMPLFVRELLKVLENNPGQNVIRQAIGYALAIFLSIFLNALANQRQRYLATKTGVALRSAIIAMIYERILMLTPQGRVGLTSGEVATLVAVDAHKIFEVTQELHLIWSMPLSVIIVGTCLVAIMGPTTIIGMVVLIMFVPLLDRVASRMLAVRHKRAKLTDQRIEIINSMLQGMKVTKLNNYEEKYKNRIEHAREQEHRLLSRELTYWALTLVVTVVSPMLASASTFAAYVLVQDGNILTSARTFTVLLLFIALRFPISYTGKLIGKLSQAKEAVRRIEGFLSRDVRTQTDLSQNRRDENMKPESKSCTVMSIENGTFGVRVSSDDRTLFSKDAERAPPEEVMGFQVSGLNFSVDRGEVVAIVGPVGSGKSTLINGIIHEAVPSAGTVVRTSGKISYVSQTPFILNATVRENILFGLAYEKELYEKVLDACCLRTDLEQLGAAGDQTEIGERGVTLSGGQKQRVSLARAAYAKPDLIVMDDPISALDAGTSKKIFDGLIKSLRQSVLSNAAIVLVTHAAHFLNRVDKIIVVVEGKTRFCGTWLELFESNSEDTKTNDFIDFIRSSVQEDSDLSDLESTKASSTKDGAKRNQEESSGRLMTVETKEYGLSNLKTWMLWFKHAGGFFFLFTQVTFMTLDRFAYVGSEYWLARWTEGSYRPLDVFGMHFPAQSEGLSAQFQYLKVFAIILLTGLVVTTLRSEWAVTGGARCAKNVFLAMLSSVMKAPMSYFETTPLGRILNRFTYDTEVIDLTLTQNMSILMISLSWLIAGIVVMMTILPWMAVAIVPTMLVYGKFLFHYRMSATDLQRLDALARSPVQALVTEGLEGTTTIRVFEQVETFVSNFYKAIDLSSSALLNYVSAQRWLGVRIELLGSLVVLSASLLVVFLNESQGLPPGIVALLIIWSSNFTLTLGFLVDSFAESEAAITSIERVDSMVGIPQEKAMVTSAEHRLHPAWPSQGLLEFQDVSLRYRDGLPLALRGLSFAIPHAKRCGVVGRTGAGKSSLTVALFRLVEIESGCIKVDGVDLGKLGLSDVRGRENGLAIIPQDPFIAGTTLRECLDPFSLSSDEQVLEALTAVRLADKGSESSLLDSTLAEGGSNYSVGERQLLNLARALLSKPKILILDEATASIDGETDAFIQRMLRTRFQETTLVTVAHRLNTIMDYDMIIVMDAGRAVEVGSPLELLERDSVFKELVAATGVESARALRDIAELANNNRTAKEKKDS